MTGVDFLRARDGKTHQKISPWSSIGGVDVVDAAKPFRHAVTLRPHME
jgi:hypothetical protein